MGAGGPFREEPSLRVENLALARGGRILFEALSFEAGAAALVEIRGANGAGKTSLLRAICGFLRPHAGRIVFDKLREPVLALHYIGHLNGLKPTASVRAHLIYWAGLLGGDPAQALDQVGLSTQAELPARALSHGQARRLALARLLVTPRPIWLLDEPAAALDAEGRVMLTGLIAAQRAKGGIVLAAVHAPIGSAPSDVVTLGGAN